MILELSEPKVLGSVDHTSFVALESLPQSRECTDGERLRQLPLYKEMAGLAGIDLGDWELIGRSRGVRPGHSQLQYPNSGWHNENNQVIAAADAIPTEFLLAEEDVLRSFWQRYCSNEPMSAQGLSARDLLRVAMQAERMKDREVKKLGFRVWSAQPSEVVLFGPTDIHRSGANLSPVLVWRNYAMAFREVTDEPRRA